MSNIAVAQTSLANGNKWIHFTIFSFCLSDQNYHRDSCKKWIYFENRTCTLFALPEEHFEGKTCEIQFIVPEPVHTFILSVSFISYLFLIPIRNIVRSMLESSSVQS